MDLNAPCWRESMCCPGIEPQCFQYDCIDTQPGQQFEVCSSDYCTILGCASDSSLPLGPSEDCTSTVCHLQLDYPECLQCEHEYSFCRAQECGLQHVNMDPFSHCHAVNDHPNLGSGSQKSEAAQLTPQDSLSILSDNGDIGAASVDPFHCHWQRCDLSFLTSLDFDQHFLEDHAKQFDSLDKTIQQPLTCAWNECQIAPVSAPALFEHIKYDHVGIEEHHRCKWLAADLKEHVSPCNMCFATAEALTKHLTTEHIGSRQSEYVCCWQDCDRCHRPFAQRQKIMRHVVIHTGDRPYVCDVCGHTCSEASVLRQHKRTHTGERPFTCTICHKTFSASTALTVHMRTHTGFKPLVCKHPGCNKRFSESSNLTKHMRSHSLARPYCCEICNKSFQRPYQLKRHNKVHEVKPVHAETPT